MNYNTLEIPAFLLDLPDNYSANIPNNPWMKKLPPAERKVDKEVALKQWLTLYNYIAGSAYVLALPEYLGTTALQDLTFVANLGIVFHTGQLIISNFTSPPRKGETIIGHEFFSGIFNDYTICPHKFEGEADLKHLHDNVYIGGYGIRSELKSYLWMMNNFDVKIVPVMERDKLCYHLDCTVFPLTREKTLVCTELFDRKELVEIAANTEIVDVSKEDAEQGICNNVRFGNLILNEFTDDKDDENYDKDIHKNQSLEKIAEKNGMGVVYFDLSEFTKGGACLSCLVMHLNRHSYNVQLL